MERRNSNPRYWSESSAAFAFFAVFLCLQACQPGDGKPSEQEVMADRLLKLRDWMTGSFNSAEQARVDTNYYPIGLQMCLIREDSGKWFEVYVEQALLSAPERPYRQRIYHVTAVDTSTFVSEIYALNEDSLYVGACGSAELKAELPLAGQYKKEGCDVVLKWNGKDAFEGGTEGAFCRNAFGGAAYATSDVRVTNSLIESWDRGYDENGVKVWGPSGKAYAFIRE